MEMANFGGRDRILDLIARSETQMGALSKSRAQQLGSSFRRAREVLQTPIPRPQSIPLLLAAARRHILEAEKNTIGWIIGDAYVPGDEMDQLVHVRLACAETVTLLNNALDQTR